MIRQFHTNTRSFVFASLLGLLITGSALLTPAVSLLAANDSPETPITAPDQLAGGECAPDHA